MRNQSVCLALAIVLVCPFASAQWVPTSQGLADSTWYSCLAVSGMNLFAGNLGGVFRSTDEGTSWTAVNDGLTDTAVMVLAVSGTNLFAGTRSAVYRSTNDGASWTLDTTGMGICFVASIAVSGANVFVGTYGGVFLSTNNGNSWSAINAGLPYGPMGPIVVGALAVDGTNLFAGSSGHGLKAYHEPGRGVFLSTDYGTNWTAVNNGLTDTSVSALATSGTNLVAGTSHWGWDNGGSVFLSTNSGTSWTQASLPNCWVKSFAISGPNLFAGTGRGVFLSTNDGTSWTQVNTGLTDTNVIALAASGTNLFAGGTFSGVWRRPLSQMITSAESFVSGLPSWYSLEQNYPNPFNPSTTIKYELPKSSEVRLSVFDMLGREVSVLVNDRREAGVHEVKFDGSNLASGVYIYRLQAGNFVQSKRFILLK
jgi:hypothetical protein